MVTCAQRNGVTGVPFTLIEGKWAISGGQGAEVFLNVSHSSTDSYSFSATESSLFLLRDKSCYFSV